MMLMESDQILFKMANDKRFPVILRTVLDRIPLLLVARENDFAQPISTVLLSLVKGFRESEQYLTSFLNQEELEGMMQLEKENPAQPRSIVLATMETISTVISKISTFKGWILHVHPEDLPKLREKVTNFSDIFVECHLDDNSAITDIRVDGNKAGEYTDFSFEQDCLKKFRNQVKVSIVGIQRIIDGLFEVAKMENYSELSLFEDSPLLDYKQEKELLLKEVLGAELDNYFISCFCASTIFKKLEKLHEWGLQTRVDRKTLENLIAYKGTNMNHMVSFVNASWGFDGSKCIETREKLVIPWNNRQGQV